MICVLDIGVCTGDRCLFFFFQAEDGIRDLVRSRGLGDVYKRQAPTHVQTAVERLGIRGSIGAWALHEGNEGLAVRALSLIHI